MTADELRQQAAECCRSPPSTGADELRLYFNDELRRHSKLAVFFDLKGLGHEM